ncbi:PRD domain-containing protein, partial [Enterococcus faecium]|nr:PRD domain-containing protein [Enterococcus faecium]
LKTSNEEYAMSVHKLIERMSEIEKIDLTQNDRLYQSLLYHVPAMVLRLKKGIKIQNPLLENIKSQYSELFSIVWYAMSILEEEFDVTLTDDEVSLILIHFQIAIEDQSKANNIIIICQYGISSAQLIYNKVRRFLPAKDNVEISTLDKFHLAEIG